MKLVISPAKSLNWEENYPTTLAESMPRFIEESVKVNASLKRNSAKKLMALQSISASLAQLNYERNQIWTAGEQRDLMKPAVYAFDGDVYRGFGCGRMGISPSRGCQRTTEDSQWFVWYVETI